MNLLQLRSAGALLQSPKMLLVATGGALGLGMPLGKLAATQGVEPLSFVLFPALVAGVLLAGLAWLRHGGPSSSRHLMGFGVVTGLLSSALPTTLSVWLATHAGASVTAVAYTLPPAITLALSLLVGLEPARWQRVTAVFIGMLGALILVATRFSGGELTGAGVAALLAIPLAIGAGNLFRALYLPARVPPEWLGAAMMLGAFAWLLPVWFLTSEGMARLSAPAWPYLAFQSIATVVGSMLYFRLQRRADAVTMSFIGYMMALTAVIVGVGFLGEDLPLALLPAVLLIAWGIKLIHRHPAR